MVEDGLNVLVVPEPLGSQVYDVAPVTPATTDFPLQIDVLVIELVMVGVELTLMEMVFVVLQLPLNPVTVYELVAVGVTAITVVVCAPGAHE